ncbi:MAG: thiamine pyrophosphate-dependent dehydrogenase E1 component subunit alpha [Candidatus Acidiferrales bacterium]
MSQTLTREQYLDLYYFMQLNRQLEERMVRLFRQNKIVGGLYSSLGQEAVSVGTCYALEKRDWIAPMIRNIGALLVKGVPPRDIFTQHMAKYTSPTKGKDGTSHFGDLKERHVVSPISMLGDLIPVMTGVAMAGRYLGHNIVALTWIGDGGSSTGAFHEGLGLAASQRAPFILIVENNQWAYSTPVTRQVPLKNLADRAVAYGIASEIVDGNDVVAVYQASQTAVDECRAGRGPRLIEVKTMRMRGHAQHDPAEYVPKQMFEYWKARDPITLYEKYLTENKVWDAQAKSEIDARIERELDAEQKFAEESPLPPAALAEEGVYCEGCHTIQAEWKRSKAEVMPPKSSINPAWRMEDLGALGEIPTAQEVATTGNGTKTPAPVAATAMYAAPVNPNVEANKAPVRSPSAALSDAPKETLEPRVPFGRGPKDKAFLQSPENPQNKPYRRGTPDKSFNKAGHDKSFGKRAQSKPFGKNPNGKPFGKNPQGKSFAKTGPDKQGRR